MKRAWVIAVGLAVLSGCSQSNERFDNGPAVANALKDAGIACDYTPSETLTGFVIPIPKAESWGLCDGIAIYVLGDKDALKRLQEGQAASSDDTPRTYWVYGDNWFIASEDAPLRDRIADALGGHSTDNTKL
jgi:hypothetical protein